MPSFIMAIPGALYPCGAGILPRRAAEIDTFGGAIAPNVLADPAGYFAGEGNGSV
jgi:hypothetical protein